MLSNLIFVSDLEIFVYLFIANKPTLCEPYSHIIILMASLICCLGTSTALFYRWDQSVMYSIHVAMQYASPRKCHEFLCPIFPKPIYCISAEFCLPYIVQFSMNEMHMYNRCHFEWVSREPQSCWNGFVMLKIVQRWTILADWCPLINLSASRSPWSRHRWQGEMCHVLRSNLWLISLFTNIVIALPMEVLATNGASDLRVHC